ncbi:MAG: TRAP transporter large permease [Deltaproteobacteria bacterium]|jgi:C4-dicarboxylate transporter DctM subunit|nr:TRAP transporter large permease [Deltaproteobacteria bacterium]
MIAILFGSFLLLLAIGVPVAFSVAIAGTTVLVLGEVPLLVTVQRMFAATDSFPLVAVPFFILAGDLLARGAISKKLVAFAEAVMGQIRGSLSVVAVVAGIFFAAISGSGAATTAAVGATLIPELKERKYREDSAAALIASAGCIGVVIPPSVPMVLYAVIADQSVTRLFQNGFVPGFMMGGILIAIAVRQAYSRHYPKGVPFAWKNVFATFLQAIWGLMMPVIILGGIFSGQFTPSEAAAVAAIYGALVSLLVYRDLSLRDILRIARGSAMTSSVIMIIIACSGIFGWVLANWKIPATVAQTVIAFSGNPHIILLLIAAIIVIAGIFMETASAVILLTPVFLPLIKMLGINLIHFGILFAVGIAIGMITPPVAINLFVASSISGLKIEQIAKAVIPYLLGLITMFLLYVYLPMFMPWLIF